MQDQSHTTLTDSAAARETAVVTPIPAAAREEGVSPMFCTQCGTRNGVDARFCKQCGHKLDRTEPRKISEEEFELPESREEKVRNLLLAAFQKYEADDLDGAVAICAEALEIRPESTDAHSLMSTLYEKKGEREKAIEERERVLELNPGSIADREKLDELKDGQISITPRKITSSRRAADSALLTSPRAQALVAVAVIVVVFGIGIGAMAWVARQQRQANAASKQGSVVNNAPRTSPVGTISNAPQTPAVGAQTPSPNPQALLSQNEASRVQSALANNANNAGASAQRRREDEGTTLGTRQVGPATVNPQIASNNGRMTGPALPDHGGVVLPETDQGSDPGNGAGNANPPNSPNSIGSQRQPRIQNPQPAPQNQGKIEIIVSPGPAPAGNSGNGGSKTATSDTGANLDSRSSLEIARDLQRKNEYARAVNAYKKALDGAGDRAADIHQSIAVCYRNLGEKDAAISHYQQAIEAAQAQIAAGKNVDTARSIIRGCQFGIKALQ